MKIIRNDKVIKRNAKIAQFSMLGGLLILAGGMFVSFKYPEQVGLSMGALLVGFLLSQIGIYFSNRWGRHPRPDEMIDSALKGLDDKYSLYHYTTPVSHLLVGPAGVWILLPYYQRGLITYQNGRFKQKGGNLYLKIFAQESLGRPELEVKGEVDSLNAYFEKILGTEQKPDINTAMVFTNDSAVIDIPEDQTPPAKVWYRKDLKEEIRKIAKSAGISLEKAKLIQDSLMAGND